MKNHNMLITVATIVFTLSSGVPGVAIAAPGDAASGAAVCDAEAAVDSNVNPVTKMLNVLEISGKLLAFLESHSAQAAIIGPSTSRQPPNFLTMPSLAPIHVTRNAPFIFAISRMMALPTISALPLNLTTPLM